jgi:hypothetical protein
MRQRKGAGEERIVQPKTTDSFNDSREHKAEGENQGRAIMGTPEADQGNRSIEETEERAANFKI